MLRLLMVAALTFSLQAILANAGRAADPADPKGLEFFEAKIRPVLVQHCYQCHSTSGKKSEGGLLLDSRDAIRKGGDRGPAVVPGDTDKSILLAAIEHTADLKMPPKKERLAKEVLGDFAKWIKMGAPDPREAVAAGFVAPVDLATGRKFWSLQKPIAQIAPEVKNADWPKQKLDYFILAKLESAGLAPSKDAEPTTLLRRLYFDLIGLPPTPAASSEFDTAIRADGLDVAIAREVDKLLGTPQFGEHWGRHWLDVARFAESSGKEANMAFPYAWRYRDYVIDAVNADIPFDRFLTEQIAGDLLPFENDTERARLLIATGFLALGPKNLDEADAQQFVADVIDEQIDTVTRAVLGNSIACARCHDHKFDPFTMHDYYALKGIFGSTRTFFGTYVTPTNRLGGDPLPLPRGVNLPVFHQGVTPQHVAHLKQQLTDLKKQQADGMAAIMKAARTGEDTEKAFTLTDALRIFWATGGIEGQLEKVDDEGQPLPLTMGVLESDKIGPARMLDRGDLKKPGDRIPRALPAVFTISESFAIGARQSGRLELAQFLTHPEQPLTARVMANRVWRHLFGAGLVRTVDNFGMSGQRPSHPELLDELAVKFRENGWSLKKLVREIVLSRTYRQSSQYKAAAFRIDPENRLLWRASKRRLTAEEIRDAMLTVGSELKTDRPAASLVGKEIGDGPISLIGLNPKIPKDLDGMRHRSVYLPVIRDRLPDVLELFDFAEPSLVSGDRETTNVPVQALYLMNSEFVTARARGLAHRVKLEVPDEAKQPTRAFTLCFGRTPDDAEQALAKQFFAATDDRDKAFVAYCQALLAAAEFRNLD
ncbi:PSD1 and planctomycete cytochrome C domain-containing protein [Anatilimnocola floriformis]|uniref:PSD1 and planctomycete cytochrome C domain-containing protein n=1 Tax=Anatilimnocola floriformis TaxID=2948575 RepID=UPI0020C439EE|nr:PSD1 and planctomycete cytochrome C domain-containing protein [Anatilimnocola floriformis]